MIHIYGYFVSMPRFDLHWLSLRIDQEIPEIKGGLWLMSLCKREKTWPNMAIGFSQCILIMKNNYFLKSKHTWTYSLRTCIKTKFYFIIATRWIVFLILFWNCDEYSSRSWDIQEELPSNASTQTVIFAMFTWAWGPLHSQQWAIWTTKVLTG